MPRFTEQLRQTGLGRELSWRSEQLRYNLTRETRVHAAQAEAEQLITPLFTTARYKPGSPEAKKLVLVGANATSHVVSEVCDPGTQFYLNGVAESVRDWATGTADLETVKQTRRTFLDSDIYSGYFNLNRNPDTTQATRRMADAISFVDEILFGAIALDDKSSAELDIADKRGTTDFKMQTFTFLVNEDMALGAYGVLPTPDAGIYSIAEMSLASHKAALSMEYSQLAAGTVASIPKYKGAAAIERFYGIKPHPTTSNPLFQERINKIIKETINSTQ